ncbi:MAG TPA: preprotein translocase subunit SecA [Iamia sp.]|nr:preprotein translocase subunit SecA [Iamia sp.]
MGVLDKLLRAGEGRKVRALAGLAPDIAAFEPELQKLSDEDLQHKTVDFREQLDRGADLDDLLLEGFAVVREAATRALGQRHYDVQMMGGAALHFGWVAEMKTGEGKTLVSTLPLYLNALKGEGVHLITVNDYLASFHSEWMGRLHRFMGLSVGLIVPGRVDSAHKRAQYACDITYGTNNEFGFDYLRDNMAMSQAAKTQRGHSYAIVDEVDSILIDEARTPLIISGRLADAAKLYHRFASIVRGLQREEDYEVDEEKRIVAPTESGVEKVEAALGVENLYDAVSQNLVHQFQAALKAKELFKRDKDYLIQGGEVKIVDEFTGRVLDGRRWSEGLHQAVEAKEGVRIKEENQTLATITLQNYFRLYEKLAGMTGTALTEAAELGATYDLQVVPIPTNKDLRRQDEADLIYKSEDGKFDAVVEDLVDRYETGQPVLVGTISVEKSEKLSRLLEKRGVPHEVLNAKQHFREAEIVTQAGRLHSITVATNMAGRGVDILLGGNPEGLAEVDVKSEGLDHEDGAEGTARYQELIERYKVETKAEGQKVRELGGLYVLGTERHDSRRIDNQLRGRSGRQGDPGESRFYLSLEDDLMRLFATGAMNWVMSKALPDDVPIEAKMVTKAIERAQNTVEQRNAEIRKNVLKYDEVMNEQRKVIYARRDEILGDADLRDETLGNLAEVVDELIGTHCTGDFGEEWDLETLLVEVATYWPTELTQDRVGEAVGTDGVYDLLIGEATAFYEAREDELGDEAMREMERQVALRLIDQHWREHLHDMDYLQEGINLRALGQKDPLVEWQREGYDMFGVMMKSIQRDQVKYVMHVQVVQEEDRSAAPPEKLQTSGPDDSANSSDDRMKAAARAQAARAGVEDTPEVVEAPSAAPIVKSDFDKTPRNAPCPCGSGKKFKLCHGRTQI